MDRETGGNTGMSRQQIRRGERLVSLNVKVHLRRLYIGLVSIISAARPPVVKWREGMGWGVPSDWGDSVLLSLFSCHDGATTQSL